MRPMIHCTESRRVVSTLYYRCYCYLPLYVFCEGYVLGAYGCRIWISEGAVQEMERIVGQPGEVAEGPHYDCRTAALRARPEMV